MPDLDRSLLRGIERGDPSALEALARHYAGPVYRYLVRLCGDATLAEDLSQEVAIQVWRGLPGRSFPNERALNAWVYTVATNAFRMHRRRKRAGEVSWDAEIDLPAGDECNPEGIAEREELALRVRRAVETLPDAEREALLLKVFSDLRYHEIAAATGEPVGTIKWRISRAYARLRRILQPELHPVENGYEPVQSPAAIPGRRDGVSHAVAHGAPPAPVPHLCHPEGR
jgi:RNA polymerase sigma-70 factor (ECF subfamily)